MIEPLINVAVPRRPRHPSRSLTSAPRKQRANFAEVKRKVEATGRPLERRRSAN